MKKVLVVSFEDCGQDFLEWKLEEVTEGIYKVIESFGQRIWEKYFVLGEPKKGKKLSISEGLDKEVRTLNYKVIKITEINHSEE